MKFRYLFVPILAVIACGSLQAQTADTTPSATPGQEEQHDGWGRHRHGAWVWRKLNLSDSQKTQIKSIREGLKPQVRPALAGVLKARLQLRQDIAANSEPGVITNDSTALATAEAQLATVRNTMWNQIKTVLNPDQLTTLNNFKQKQEAHTQEMISKLSQPAS
ncbi:MAG TPA: Spy/CpxP family protein refolding chaperone [Chthoniobacterales bacterium]|nr:Spy/CpxP family protein refolding chaperone [Chthoniobacterales bacterium]